MFGTVDPPPDTPVVTGLKVPVVVVVAPGIGVMLVVVVGDTIIGPSIVPVQTALDGQHAT